MYEKAYINSISISCLVNYTKQNQYDLTLVVFNFYHAHGSRDIKDKINFSLNPS